VWAISPLGVCAASPVSLIAKALGVTVEELEEQDQGNGKPTLPVYLNLVACYY
jgi:hypothetical protein